MAKVNPLLAWSTELFLQYFRQAASASISQPLIRDVDEDDHVFESSSPLRGNY